MSYTRASTDDVENVVDEEHGGLWFLRDALDGEELGVSILELEPDAQGKEHDHGHDGQEEVYVCVDGTVTVDCGDDAVELSPNEAIRVSPEQSRQIRNTGEIRARLVLVGSEPET